MTASLPSPAPGTPSRPLTPEEHPRATGPRFVVLRTDDKYDGGVIRRYLTQDDAEDSARLLASKQDREYGVYVRLSAYRPVQRVEQIAEAPTASPNPDTPMRRPESAATSS